MQDCFASLADVKASLYSKKLKSSSPQVPLEDMEMIAGIFPGEGINEGSGKKFAISTVLIMTCFPYSVMS
jgi:hypothetical protein